VLIRPRAGSFVYSGEEIEQMRRQIAFARKAGAGGVVIGVLHADSSVDVPATHTMVELARPMRVTFHRAFDETDDRLKALEYVFQTGADCLLTSGGAPNVLAGADELARLRQRAAGRLEIMPGGGLRLNNLAEVVQRSGADWVHGSFAWRAGADAQAPGAETVERRVREAVRMLRSL
jgi:copper homeostasis protein